MFIPLGFGNWPRLFPLAIAFISSICIGWSISYFPTVKAAKVKVRAEAKKFIGQKDALTKLGAAGKPQVQAAQNSYDAALAAILKEFNLTTSKNLSFASLLRATFTHSGFGHLFGNLFFLILFGMWVDQRMGPLWSGGVFLGGSFVGIFTQTLAEPNVYVLGASAGVSSLMGAFFVFFFRAEFHFMFTLGFLYFKRVVMPLLWVFPAFYVMADFTALLSRSNNGVAHLAHLAGFVFGCAIGLTHKLLHPVPAGQLFAPEENLLKQLREAQHPQQVTNIFGEIMRWNPQNVEAMECFLMKMSQGLVAFRDVSDFQRYTPFISAYVSRIFKSGTAKEIIQAVEHFPQVLPLADYISEVPLRQLLKTADFTAESGYYFEALVMYRAAFPRLTEERQREAVRVSINTIMQAQLLQQQKVSGG